MGLTNEDHQARLSHRISIRIKLETCLSSSARVSDRGDTMPAGGDWITGELLSSHGRVQADKPGRIGEASNGQRSKTKGALL
jgi:hypothetical protein